MDLAVSPDLDAVVCYGVVFLCGVISARIQIYRRLSESNITSIWLEAGTWVMFAVYLAIPLSLFWLMDRVGAFHDTSLFAALLVGCAYPAILAGGYGGLKAPAGVADIWKPVEAFTSFIVKRVVKVAAQNNKRFEDYIVGQMMAKQATFDGLLQLAQTQAIDAQNMAAELQAIEAAANVGAATPQSNMIRERKARRIFLYVSSITDYESILYRNKLINDKWFLWNAPVYRNWFVSIVGALVLIAMLGGGITLIAASPDVRVSYLIWRLGKANNTAADRFRSRERLAEYLSDEDSQLAAMTRLSLAWLLRSPGLAADQVDLVLQVLLQSRNSQDICPELWEELVSALRVENVDTRSRIQHALVFLAEENDPQFQNTELASWNPNKGDSITSLEKWLDQWREFWRTGKAQPKVESSPADDLTPSEAPPNGKATPEPGTEPQGAPSGDGAPSGASL